MPLKPHSRPHPHRAVTLGDGLGRFLPPGLSDFPPFPGFERPPAAVGPLPQGFPIRPRYQRRARTWHISFPGLGRASFYGTGMNAGPLLRNGTRVSLWNSDSYDYTDKTPALYQSHP
jgi:hypothetical protein